MNCDMIRGKLPDRIEGLLQKDDDALVTGHLASCAKCRREYEDLRRTVAHLKNLEEVEPPEWLAKAIMLKVKEVAEQKQGRWRALFRPLPFKVSLAAAASVLIAVIALYLFRATQPAIEVLHGIPGHDQVRSRWGEFDVEQKSTEAEHIGPPSNPKRIERKEAPGAPPRGAPEIAGARKPTDEEVAKAPANKDLCGDGNGSPSPGLQAGPMDRSARPEGGKVPAEIPATSTAPLGKASAPNAAGSVAPLAARKQSIGQRETLLDTKEKRRSVKIAAVTASVVQTTDLLKKDIQSHLGEINGCYKKGRGKVSIAFVVTAEGDTKQPEVITDDTGEADGGKCLVEEIKKWHFSLMETPEKVSVTFEVLP